MIDTANTAIDTAKYPFRLCHIADRKGDLGKRWYVKFYVWDLGSSRLKPIQEYGELSQYATYQSRYRAAQKLKTRIDNLLKAGYVINSSLDDDQYIEKKSEVDEREKMSITQAFDYALKLKSPEVSKNTVKAYTTTVERFKEYLKARQLSRQHISTLNTKLVNGFFDWLKGEYINPQTGKPLKAATINNNRTYFRTMINVLKQREEIITEDPSRLVPKMKQGTTYHEIYLDDEITRIREHLERENPHLWLLCQFTYYCYIRPRKEARLLQVKHIKQNNVLAITEDVSKTDIRFPVIPTPLQASLKQWNISKYPGHFYLFSEGGEPGPNPCYLNYWGNQWVQLRADLGLSDDKTIYSWKHTGACKLYLATKDPNKVREQCGHKSLETTLVYLRQLGMFDNKEVENLFPEI